MTEFDKLCVSLNIVFRFLIDCKIGKADHLVICDSLKSEVYDDPIGTVFLTRSEFINTVRRVRYYNENVSNIFTVDDTNNEQFLLYNHIPIDEFIGYTTTMKPNIVFKEEEKSDSKEDNPQGDDKNEMYNLGRGWFYY